MGKRGIKRFFFIPTTSTSQSSGWWVVTQGPKQGVPCTGSLKSPYETLRLMPSADEFHNSRPARLSLWSRLGCLILLPLWWGLSQINCTTYQAVSVQEHPLVQQPELLCTQESFIAPNNLIQLLYNNDPRPARVEDYLRGHPAGQPGEPDELQSRGSARGHRPDLQRPSLSSAMERLGLLQMLKVLRRRCSGDNYIKHFLTCFRLTL